MPQAPAYIGPAANPVNLVDGLGRSFLPDGGGEVRINVSASGDTVLVPAVAGKRIYCYAYRAISDTGQQVGFKDGTTFVEGPFACGATSIPGGAAPSVVPPAWLFRTALGNALVINLSQAIHVGGGLNYWYDID